MNVESIIKAAIPGADEVTIDHVIWARTPYPFSRLTPQRLFKAASGFSRACRKGFILCDHCHNKTEGDDYMCSKCRDAISQPDEVVIDQPVF